MVKPVARKTKLRVFVTDGRGRLLSMQSLASWLISIAPPTARGDLTIALVGDAKSKNLNFRFRGIDRATDVLSFPADSHPGVARDRPHILGDVVIATGVARRQARRIGDTFENELRRLSLHGLLHVLGYDHETDNGEMARIERKLLRCGGVSESSE